MAFGKTVKDPFSTPVGRLIEIHTVSTNKSEDWGQFVNICDVINTTAEGPRDAAKALKKKISKNYNHKEVGYCLSLLEMCMQDCNTTFQSLVLKKEFCKDVLVKLLNPKYNLPLDMQNRILRFIKTWSSGSQGNVDLREVKELYVEMIKKGIQFPTLDATEETRTKTQRGNTMKIQVEKKTSPISDRTTTPSCTETSVQQLSSEQIGKLYSELDMVKINMKVMSEILLENTPGAEDTDLLKELEKVCREMQARIVKLLEIVQNEDVIIELVQVNDDLNNIFLRHTRFLRNRSSEMTNNMNQDKSVTGINKPSAPSSELVDLDLDPLQSTQNQTNGYPPPSAAIPVLVPNVNPHQAPNFETGSPQQPPQDGNRSNFMYPQMDLLELKESVNTPINSVVDCAIDYTRNMETLWNGDKRKPLKSMVPYSTTFPPTIQTANPFFPRVPASTPFFPLAQHPTPLLPTVPISMPPLPVETNSSLFPAVPTLCPTLVPLSMESTNKPSEKSETSSSAQLPNYYELLEFDPLTESNKTEAIYEEIDFTSLIPKKSSS